MYSTDIQDIFKTLKDIKKYVKNKLIGYIDYKMPINKVSFARQNILKTIGYFNVLKDLQIRLYKDYERANTDKRFIVKQCIERIFSLFDCIVHNNIPNQIMFFQSFHEIMGPFVLTVKIKNYIC